MAKRQLGLEEIAAEVGRLFGTTESHARKWLDQRNVLLEALGSVRDKANVLMSELGGLPSSFGKKKRGRPANTANTNQRLGEFKRGSVVLSARSCVFRKPPGAW